MLKMASFDTNTRTETFAPLIIVALSITLCLKPWQTSTAASVYRRHELSFTRPAAALLPKLFNQFGSELGCWLPKIWWNERRCLSLQNFDCLALALEERTRYRSYAWQAVASELAQKHLKVICAIIFTPGSTNIRAVRTVTENGRFINFKFSKGSAVTHLRCGGKYGITLLQISRRVWQWQHIEDRPTVVKVMNV